MDEPAQGAVADVDGSGEAADGALGQGFLAGQGIADGADVGADFGLAGVEGEHVPGQAGLGLDQGEVCMGVDAYDGTRGG